MSKPSKEFWRAKRKAESRGLFALAEGGGRAECWRFYSRKLGSLAATYYPATGKLYVGGETFDGIDPATAVVKAAAVYRPAATEAVR